MESDKSLLSPLALEWQWGSVPAVETVPCDCLVVLWSPHYIGLIYPSGDTINPLRWADDAGMPQWGITPPQGWWAWVRSGRLPKPEGVKTWGEYLQGQPAWDQNESENH